LADHPENWVVNNFKKWRHRGRHPTTASYAISLAGTTISTATTTAPTPTKVAEDAWLSWQRSKRDAEAQAPLKPTVRRPEPMDYERMRKYFGHVPADIVHQTYKYTTQIGLLPPSTHLRRQFKSPNPALNLHRRNEADATD